MRALLIGLAFISSLCGALPAGVKTRSRVVITVDLARRLVHVYKYEAPGRKPLHFEAPTLAVVKGSVRAGTFRARLPTLLVKRERSATRLDHALLFDGQHALRSSTHFKEMASHPIAGSVILPGEYGGLIATAVAAAGGAATIIVRD